MVESSFDSHRDDISFQILAPKREKECLNLLRAALLP